MRPETACQTNLPVRFGRTEGAALFGPSQLNMAQSQILIRVNGAERRTVPGQTLMGLFVELALDPQRVAVELNREIVRRPRWAETILSDGDSLEIVEFVGGG